MLLLISYIYKAPNEIVFPAGKVAIYAAAGGSRPGPYLGTLRTRILEKGGVAIPSTREGCQIPQIVLLARDSG